MKTTGFDCMKCGGVGTYGVRVVEEDYPRLRRWITWQCASCNLTVWKTERVSQDGAALFCSLFSWASRGLCYQRRHLTKVSPYAFASFFSGFWVARGAPGLHVDDDGMVACLTGGAP